jgi:hypothetical protein
MSKEKAGSDSEKLKELRKKYRKMVKLCDLACQAIADIADGAGDTDKIIQVYFKKLDKL